MGKTQEDFGLGFCKQKTNFDHFCPLATHMRSLFILVVALLFTSCLCDGVAQAGAQGGKDPATQILPGTPDADTTYIFPDVNEEEGLLMDIFLNNYFDHTQLKYRFLPWNYIPCCTWF